KTTARTFLEQKLGDFGFYPIFVPEAATLLIDHRITPLGDAFSRLDFQRHVLAVSLALEAEAEKAAARVRHPKPVILTDRGIVDQLPYVGDRRAFEALLAEYDLSYGTASERYDAVMHMRTAALGAEAFYSNENNPARYETADEARAQDERTLEAWIGHTHLRVISNDGSLERKMKRLLAEICAVLGIPEPVEIERKFRVALPIPFEMLGAYETVEIEQCYLATRVPGEELRVRARTQHGVTSYFRTRKRATADAATRYETEEAITPAEYAFGRSFMKSGTRPVQKRRTCFVYENQYFELDTFLEPKLPYALLEIELAEAAQPVRVPPFLTVEKEVTGDPHYSNSALARL
ncbi:MAG: hypothetical protein B7W98_02670, partial [Parcubacteria group bacterium 20-58-5]